MNHLDKYIGKTAIVTGGAGLIGSNLVRALIECGVAKVTVVDDLSASEKWNVLVHPSVEFIEGSILDYGVLRTAFRNGADVVFHLAAHFANQNSVDNPEADLDVNGLGILRVLEYSKEARVGKFVFASSGCSVYGSQAPLPLREDYISLHLDTPYQITKLLGELYCNYFHNHYGLPVTIARYFNVYGEGEIPGTYRNVIPNFMWWALQGEPLPITGTGEETRDFTYVGDIVDGTLRLGVIPEAIGGAFNLASDTETKVIDIANIVNALAQNEDRIEFVQRRDWDKCVRRRASIEKACKILGYNPQTKMEAGIKAVYDWIVFHRDRIWEKPRFS